MIVFLFKQWCVAQRERMNPTIHREREEKSCKVSAGLLLATLSWAPNVLNISLRNIFPAFLVAILRQLKIPRSLLFARGGGAFLCIGSQERKRLLLQTTNSRESSLSLPCIPANVEIITFLPNPEIDQIDLATSVSLDPSSTSQMFHKKFSHKFVCGKYG